MCDYHATFKALCDNFSIDLIEFQQIFNANESAFVIWDTDNNGLIDALELFSGMALFSDAKFDDTVRFLFDLFDLNELESLSFIDFEFMLYSSLIATNKIYSINDEIQTDLIQNFIENELNLDSESRYTVTDFLKIIKSNP